MHSRWHLNLLQNYKARGSGETVVCVTLNTPLLHCSSIFTTCEKNKNKLVRSSCQIQQKIHSTCASYNKSPSALIILTNSVTGLSEFLRQKTPPTAMSKQKDVIVCWQPWESYHCDYRVMALKSGATSRGADNLISLFTCYCKYCMEVLS